MWNEYKSFEIDSDYRDFIEITDRILVKANIKDLPSIQARLSDVVFSEYYGYTKYLKNKHK